MDLIVEVVPYATYLYLLLSVFRDISKMSSFVVHICILVLYLFDNGLNAYSIHTFHEYRTTLVTYKELIQSYFHVPDRGGKNL